MISIVFLKEVHKSQGHPVNKCITNTLGEHNVAGEGVHHIHHVLIISKDGDANLVALAINVTLLDVVEGCLGLISVARANLSKNGCTNLMPHELENLVVGFEADVIQIHVSGPQIKVRFFQ
jgi:hypothetical protein